MKNVLIFDYDGVIVDSFDIFMNNFISACKKNGWDSIASEKDFLKLFENNMYESMFAMGMTKEQILKIVYYMKDALLQNQDKIHVFTDIAETLKDLSRENRMIIVTSNETETVKSFLAYHKIECFDEILGSDKGASKFEKIKDIKKESNGSNIFYIGDTQGDIIEGRKAEVKTVAVTWGWHSEEKLRKVAPDFIIKKPNDLLKIIN